MRCSIAPKMLRPSRSSISIRTRVAELHERRHRFAGFQRFDRALSAKHEAPFGRCPVGDRAGTDDRAGRQRPGLRRVRDQLREIELHVTPASGRAEPGAVDVGEQRQVHFAPRQASPVRPASRTPAQVPNAADCRKPKPFASSGGIRLRSETSLTRPTSWMCAAACSGVAAIGTSSVTTTISGLQVDAVVLADHLDRIARAVEAGAGGLVHQRIDVKLSGTSAPARGARARRAAGAAVDEFVGARGSGAVRRMSRSNTPSGCRR